MKPFVEYTHSISFFGRPYEELLRCFGVSEERLRGKTVLDCPAGPSAFVAEANRRGIAATGVDPLFYRSPEALERLARCDFEEMFARVRQNSDRFVARTYASIDEAERVRRAAIGVFLEDYRSGFAAGRYRCGALPRLDFPNRSFDVVLCAHLLFVYAEKLDFAFHRDAIAELCRVAAEEVRIHPLTTSSNGDYPGFDELLEAARSLGFEPSVESVEHEFFRGSNRTLVLRRASV